ncbi:MAG TPA: NAD(P)-binding domain-containing protein, partial [Gammaproteobacteria bacterium]
MNDYRIGFVGGGNMARSLIGGLTSGGVAAARISVHDPDHGKSAELAGRFGVAVEPGNAALLQHVEVVVLAVKPQALRAVAGELRQALPEQPPLLISIAAGVREASLARWLGRPLA